MPGKLGFIAGDASSSLMSGLRILAFNVCWEMFRKWPLQLMIVVLAAWLIYYLWNNHTYAVFTPTAFLNGDVVAVDVSHEVYSRLQKVLHHYNERHFVNESGRIMVTKRLAQDEDLLLSYTNKAQDSTWLQDKGIDFKVIYETIFL